MVYTSTGEVISREIPVQHHMEARTRASGLCDRKECS